MPVPSSENDPQKPFLPHPHSLIEVFLRVTIDKINGSLKLSVAYLDDGHDITSRFPTGAPSPTVSSVTGELFKVFDLEDTVTVTATEGQIFAVKTESKELKAKVTSCGDLDVISPSISPATRETRFFEFKIF